jgi:hypothetical protein
MVSFAPLDPERETVVTAIGVLLHGGQESE